MNTEAVKKRKEKKRDYYRVNVDRVAEQLWTLATECNGMLQF
jgi:hypothetical protein